MYCCCVVCYGLVLMVVVLFVIDLPCVAECLIMFCVVWNSSLWFVVVVCCASRICCGLLVGCCRLLLFMVFVYGCCWMLSVVVVFCSLIGCVLALVLDACCSLLVVVVLCLASFVAICCWSLLRVGVVLVCGS